MKHNFMGKTAKIIAEIRSKTCIDDVDVEALKEILQDAYEEGYDEGYDKCCDDWEVYSHKSGLDVALNNAYYEGYSDGHADGYSDGYSKV